jgi:hypothetical protein
VVTFFLVSWYKAHELRDGWHWLILGLLLGFATLVRPQNALLALVFLADGKWLWGAARENIASFLKAIALPFIIGGVIGVAPRFPAFAVLYGNAFALPKLDEMHWLNHNLVETLFNDYNGILPWTKVFAPGVAGLILGWKRDRRLCAGLLLVLAVQVYVNAANEVWWSGGSFGNRRLTDYSIIIAWGLWLLLQITAKWVRMTAVVSVALCCTWTFTLLLAERRLIVPLDKYVPFSGPDFSSNLIKVYSEPIETWKSLTRALPGHVAARAGAAGLLFVVLWVVMGQIDLWRRSGLKRVIGTGLVTIMLGISGLVTLAAFRTPAISNADMVTKLGSSSGILWDNYVELANYYLVKRDFPAARMSAEKAISMRPEVSTGYWYRAMAELHGSDPTAAAKDFRMVMKLDPNHANAEKMAETADELAGEQQAPSTKELEIRQPTGEVKSDWRVK